MKLKTQFVLAICLFVVTVLLIIASVVFTNLELDRIDAQLELSTSIERGVSELGYLTTDYLLFGEDQQHLRWESKWSSLSKDLSALSPGTPEERAIERLIEDDLKSLQFVFADVSERISSSTAEDAQANQDAIRISWSRMAVQNQETAFDALRLSRTLRNRRSDLGQSNILLVLILVASIFIYFVSNYLFVSRRALSGIAKLRAGMEVIGSGNLDHELKAKRNDEIGALAKSFNSMTANLKNITASKAELENEVAERKRVEDELRQASAMLEQRVAERTAELSESEVNLRRLSGQLLDAQEKERQRIGRELHDGVGQLLAGVKFRIESTLHDMKEHEIETSYLEAVVPILQECVKEVRRVQRDLHPPSLETLGIIPTLQALCRDFADTYPDIEVQCRLRLDETALSAQQKTAIYRVAQEAMNNVAKHSGAHTVILSLTKARGAVRLSVKDNGRGFDPTVVGGAGSSAGLGLSSMRERIEPNGGSLIIESIHGKGTTVTAIWPQ